MKESHIEEDFLNGQMGSKDYNEMIDSTENQKLATLESTITNNNEPNEPDSSNQERVDERDVSHQTDIVEDRANEDTERDARNEYQSESCESFKLKQVKNRDTMLRMKETKKRDQLAERYKRRAFNENFLYEIDQLRQNIQWGKGDTHTKSNSVSAVEVFRGRNPIPRSPSNRNTFKSSVRDRSPIIERLYKKGVAKLRAQSIERTRRSEENDPKKDLEKLHRLAASTETVNVNIERMYNQGVAKLRAQSVERRRLSEVNDTKFQLNKLNKLIARTNILSPNTERVYQNGVAKLRINVESRSQLELK
jgi:hypothetical protein